MTLSSWRLVALIVAPVFAGRAFASSPARAVASPAKVWVQEGRLNVDRNFFVKGPWFSSGAEASTVSKAMVREAGPLLTPATRLSCSAPAPFEKKAMPGNFKVIGCAATPDASLQEDFDQAGQEELDRAGRALSASLKLMDSRLKLEQNRRKDSILKAVRQIRRAQNDQVIWHFSAHGLSVAAKGKRRGQTLETSLQRTQDGLRIHTLLSRKIEYSLNPFLLIDPTPGPYLEISFTDSGEPTKIELEDDSISETSRQSIVGASSTEPAVAPPPRMIGEHSPTLAPERAVIFASFKMPRTRASACPSIGSALPIRI